MLQLQVRAHLGRAPRGWPYGSPQLCLTVARAAQAPRVSFGGQTAHASGWVSVLDSLPFPQRFVLEAFGFDKLPKPTLGLP